MSPSVSSGSSNWTRNSSLSSLLSESQCLQCLIDSPKGGRPVYSYHTLVRAALLDASNKALMASEVISTIENKFSYFKTERGQPCRYFLLNTLSNTQCFIPTGQGSNPDELYWSYAPALDRDLTNVEVYPSSSDFSARGRRGQANRKHWKNLSSASVTTLVDVNSKEEEKGGDTWAELDVEALSLGLSADRDQEVEDMSEKNDERKSMSEVRKTRSTTNANLEDKASRVKSRSKSRAKSKTRSEREMVQRKQDEAPVPFPVSMAGTALALHYYEQRQRQYTQDPYGIRNDIFVSEGHNLIGDDKQQVRKKRSMMKWKGSKGEKAEDAGCCVIA